MRAEKLQMGMKTIVWIVDPCQQSDLDQVFDYFDHVDLVFSPFKMGSEVSRFGRGEIRRPEVSPELDEVLALAEKTKVESGGYFDVWHNGRFDPSGIVKGWAINLAAEMLRKKGFKNFYIEAGGDIEVAGKNDRGQDWQIGVRHPFEKDNLAEVVHLSNAGIATSGTYLLGQHIYNPKKPGSTTDLLSLTVVGPNVYEADRFATAAFAMGRAGLRFIDSIGLAGLAIYNDQKTEMTGGFRKCLA